MQGPIITVDVSKGSCYFQGFLDSGTPFRKPKVLHDTKTDFQEFGEFIQKIQEKTTAMSVPVIFEATRVYH